MKQERVVFQTKRSFAVFFFGTLVAIIFLGSFIYEAIVDLDIRAIIGGFVFFLIFIWGTTTQEKQITLYETYLRIDSKANVLFKPKEFKYADIKQIIVSYKSWRPTFVAGINIKYIKHGKEYEKRFLVDVQNRNIEYPELLKHLKELGVYAYEVENI